MQQIFNNVPLEGKARMLVEFLRQRPRMSVPTVTGKLNLPVISVIMPSYNQVQFIERSILSVLNQAYPNIELIIIDGGSSDGTVEVIKKYEKHLAYWHSGSDEGQSDALNHGFSKASGDIFGWLNSDDLYLPGALENVAEAFMANKETTVVFGDWWDIDGHDKLISENYAFDFSLGQFIYEGFHLNSQAMFWRREVHERFGVFDIKLHRTMDYDLIVRLGQVEGQKAFKRITQPLACFRRHYEQKTRLHEENEGLDYDPIVRNEHQLIARKNGFENKYTGLGKFYRLFYRFRRAYWYTKRGGIGHTYARFVRK